MLPRQRCGVVWCGCSPEGCSHRGTGPALCSPRTTKWPDMDHGHQHRPLLLQGHRLRHGPRWQPRLLTPGCFPLLLLLQPLLIVHTALLLFLSHLSTTHSLIRPLGVPCPTHAMVVGRGHHLSLFITSSCYYLLLGYLLAPSALR